jgi:phosphatidylglycerophosphatase A
MAKDFPRPFINRRVMNKLGWLLGTGLGSGLAPFAPATVASFITLAVYYAVPISGDSPALFLAVGLGFPSGIWATGTLVRPTLLDPPQAVWDEVIGMLATCLLLPKTIPWLLAAFVCFRVLDIVKPFPINRLERLPGGVGIMADDLLAGLVGAAALNLVRLFFFN